MELDDDVVGAPIHWDTTMREALRRLPTIGFLAADSKTIRTTSRPTIVIASALTSTVPYELNGVRLLSGPPGGTCAMIPADVYRRVGGFRQDRKWAFWQEEPAFIDDIGSSGTEDED